jgi:5-formyltetrahydrofolate cyclo-ligase
VAERGVGERKQALREWVWSRMTQARVAAFPGARGRIPNFTGAGQAARRLAETAEWRRASTIKCNPDSPQRAVRLAALREGKLVFMAVPRLREPRCFWELDARRIPDRDLARAATIAGASQFGRAVDPREMPGIDLVVAGSVAVGRDGARIGKGGGYSDLEYAIGRSVGFIGARTIVATTVHPLQLLDEELPVTAHDFRLDLIVTPDETIRVRRAGAQPRGVLRDHLTDELRRDVPILVELGLAD